MTDKAISPLRQRLIEDMAIRRLGPKTQHEYIRRVKGFADFLGRFPAKATAEDVHRYQLRLASIGATVSTVNATASALRFFFKVTLKRSDLADEVVSVREPRRLPVVLSPEEVGRLLAATTNIKQKASLSPDLRHWPASIGGHIAEAHRYRQGPHGHPGRTGQRQEGSVCYPLAQPSRAVARMVARRAQEGMDASRPALAVSRLPRAAHQCAPPSPARSHGSGTRWHYQACRCPYAAAQLCHPSAGAKDRYPGHPEPAPAKAGVLLGHKKLDTTALYTRVAISAIGKVTSPLDLLLKMPG